jgi:hypothetical protein
VSNAVVWAYLSALGGVPALLVLLAGFVGTELLRVGATVWLSVWTGAAIIPDRVSYAKAVCMNFCYHFICNNICNFL